MFFYRPYEWYCYTVFSVGTKPAAVTAAARVLNDPAATAVSIMACMKKLLRDLIRMDQLDRMGMHSSCSTCYLPNKYSL